MFIIDINFPYHVQIILGSNGKSFPEFITLPTDFNHKCVLSQHRRRTDSILWEEFNHLKIRCGQSFRFCVSIYTPASATWTKYSKSLDDETDLTNSKRPVKFKFVLHVLVQPRSYAVAYIRINSLDQFHILLGDYIDMLNISSTALISLVI